MRFRRTTLISSFFIAILVGLVIGQRDVVVSLASLTLLCGVALWFRASRLLIVPLVAAGLVLGIWRGHQALGQYHDLRQSIGQKVSVVGEVADDPTETNGHIRFTLGNIILDGRPVSGVIDATSYPVSLKRGYRLQLDGKLKEGFATKPASLGFAKLTILSTKLSLLERWRQTFFAAVHTALPDPLASFALGLLIGARALIPKTIQDQLNAVGLSHLIAVSGYNLTIITAVAYRYLRPRSRYLATAGSLWLIAGFVVVAGASASVVRAALVAVLALAASWWGRDFKPLVLVSFAAVVTAFINPWNITRDVGWQLSFLAFFGILVVAPTIERRLFSDEAPKLASLFIESTAAQLVTFPLIIAVFHTFSPISPLANVIILPLVPVAMLASFVAGIGAMIALPIAGYLAWPAATLLQAMLTLIAYLSTWRIAQVSATLSIWQETVIYALMGSVLVTMVYAKDSSREPKNDIIKPERLGLAADLEPQNQT